MVKNSCMQPTHGEFVPFCSMIIVSAAAFFRRQSARLVTFLVFSICFSPCFLNINNRFGFSENKAAAEPAAGARIAVRTALLKKVENFRTLMYHIIKIVGLYAPGSPRLLIQQVPVV